MRIGEIVGGAALVGVAVLVGIAVIDDPTPASNTVDTSPFVFATTSTSPTTTSTPATSAPATTPTTPAKTTTSVPAVRRTTTTEPATTTVPSTTSPVTTEAPPPTSIPPVQRAAIAVRVLNGGARANAATTMSDVLRSAGFAPPGPADARSNVTATRVIFAPGRELEAATVNEVVGARPENVVPATADDPNWTQFGFGLAVLVVLGPAGT